MRLRDTRNIIRNNFNTTINLLHKTDMQISTDYHKLNVLRGAIIRTSRQTTLNKQLTNLKKIVESSGHNTPRSADRTKMLNSISWCKRKNSFLRFAAINQSIITLCVTYEDFVQRVLLKYYEEDIRRLKNDRETFKNSALVDALVRGDNIHRTLAEINVDSIMYGSLEKWYENLNKIGMDLTLSTTVKELFLIRNCLVHNSRKVSSQLHHHDTAKFELRKNIRLTVEDVDAYKDALMKSMDYIIGEYSRCFPINKGTWISQA